MTIRVNSVKGKHEAPKVRNRKRHEQRKKKIPSLTATTGSEVSVMQMEQIEIQNMRETKKSKPRKDQRRPRRDHSISNILRISLVVLVGLAQLYVFCITTSIFPIKELRDIYIETAMSTYSHQWLATAFIPASIIDKVMAESYSLRLENVVAESDVIDFELGESDLELCGQEVEVSPIDTVSIAPKAQFVQLFPEIDISTMPEDTDYTENIMLENCTDLEIKTWEGDTVWGIDSYNKILIIDVKGEGYVGKLAIVKGSARVKLVPTKYTSRGMTVTELCEEYNGILGINGNAFEDPEGHGNGSSPVGLIICDGVQVNIRSREETFQIAGFDYTNHFRVGSELDLSELRDALEFFPILVLNGEKHATGSFGLGIQPRSVIGQNKAGDTMFLIIDGRQVGYSLGTTVSICADILLRYDCQNAMNLDGGSSASMTYNGKMITKTSSPSKEGRYLPSAWIVLNSDLAEETATKSTNNIR